MSAENATIGTSVFSANRTREVIPPQLWELMKDYIECNSAQIFALDPPEHKRIRDVAQALFRTSVVNELRPQSR